MTDSYSSQVQLSPLDEFFAIDVLIVRFSVKLVGELPNQLRVSPNLDAASIAQVLVIYPRIHASTVVGEEPIEGVLQNHSSISSMLENP
jgi:hypothetical protein